MIECKEEVSHKVDSQIKVTKEVVENVLNERALTHTKQNKKR